MSSFNNQNIANDVRNWLDASYPDLVMRNHPTYALASHSQAYGGQIDLPWAVGYTAAEATSMNTAVGIANAQTQRRKPKIDWFKRYFIEDVDLAEAAYSQDKDVAATDVLIDAVKKTMIIASEAAEKFLWGTGYGDQGKIKSYTNPSGNTYVLTLASAADAWKWQTNFKGVSKQTVNNASMRAGTFTVTSTDPINGTVTVLGDGTWAPNNNDFIGRYGVMAASTAMVTWPGIPAFNPDVNNRPQANESFFGVDRSENPLAMAGIAIDCTGQPVKQALNTLLQYMSNVKGRRIDTGLLNFADYGRLLDDLGSNRVNLSVEGEMGVNFDGVRFMGPSGPLNVVPATFVPQGRVQVGDISTLHIKSPDPKFIDQKAENGAFIEVQDNDTARIAIRMNGFAYISDPAAWGNALI